MTIEERLNALVNPSQRNLILFACGCVREVWHLLKEDSKRGVLIAEGYANGLVNNQEMKQAVTAAGEIYINTHDPDDAVSAAWAAFAAIATAVYGTTTTLMINWASHTASIVSNNSPNKTQALTKQHQLFDDIFGS